MTSIPSEVKHKGAGEIQRSVLLYLILAVMGWVGYSVNQQNITQAKMQAKFEDMQESLKPVTDALPSLSREVDKHDIQLSDHERRITALEQTRSARP